MELIEKEIAEWIKPYATIVGEKIEVDDKLKKENPTKYFLRLTIPDNFQDYAIALHSYWINHRVSKDDIRERQNEDEDFPEADYTRIKWKDFYKIKDVSFGLNKAILDSVEWKKPCGPSMNNELYPGEGLMDKEHLESLIAVVNELYGNQEIELFYIYLATNDWEKSLMYRGKVNELSKLFDEKKLRFTPSLIYSKEGNWVVNTDYDLAFSTIGGEKRFISELVKRNKDEIFLIKR